MTMNEHMLSQPLWVVIWIMIMIGLHIAAIPFAIKDWRPRIMVITMILNAIFMSALFQKFGYTRILGLSHVVFWTPLLAYFCLLYTSPSPRDLSTSRMPSSA